MISMGEWRYSSMHSLFRHWLNMSGQLRDMVALNPQGTSPGTHSGGGQIDPRTILKKVDELYVPSSTMQMQSQVPRPVFSPFSEGTLYVNGR